MNTRSSSLSDAVGRALVSCEEQYPYLQAALDRMPVIEAPGIGTAACSDRAAIYIDPKFAAGLDRDAAGGLIAHEIWHYLSEHFRRRGGRDPQAWNIATDAEINDDLGPLPEGGIYPSSLQQPDGLLAEEYYDALPDSGSRDSQFGGSAADGVQREWESAHASVDDGDAVRDAVAHQISSGGPGVSDAARKWAARHQRVRMPPLPLRLRAAMRRAGLCPHEPEATYARPSRRQERSDSLVKPGRVVPDARSVAVLLDTSGSMTWLSGWLIGCLRRVASIYGDVEWVLGDVAVRDRGRLRTLSQLVGGGGTALGSILRVLDSEGHSGIVVLTDGETNDWPGPRELRTPVAVVLPDGGTVPPKHLPAVFATALSTGTY